MLITVTSVYYLTLCPIWHWNGNISKAIILVDTQNGILSTKFLNMPEITQFSTNVMHGESQATWQIVCDYYKFWVTVIPPPSWYHSASTPSKLELLFVGVNKLHSETLSGYFRIQKVCSVNLLSNSCSIHYSRGPYIYNYILINTYQWS